MKKYSIFIRILCMVSILPICAALFYAVLILSEKYVDKHDQWQRLYFSQPTYNLSVPSDWAYSEGNGELYCTSKLMNESDFDIYLTKVQRDEKNEELFHNQYLGNFDYFKEQPEITDSWKDYSIGRAKFIYQGAEQEKTYVSLRPYYDNFYLVCWDKDVNPDILEYIGTHKH